VAVAEELHFTRAAERLYIAQPALSEQIRRLESDLGVELLRRTTRKVQLTPAGEEFLVRARRILAEADEAVSEAARAARGESGRLRVSTGATAGIEDVARILRAFRASRPGVELDLRQISWEDHSGGLNSGAVDAAFVWLPFAGEGLAFETIHEEPRVAALAADHPLAAHEQLTIDQIVDEPWPYVDTDPVALGFWTLVDFRGGAEARRGPTISSIEGILEGVRAGLCVSTVPTSISLVQPWPGIAFRPVGDLPPARLALGWREDAESPLVQALVTTAIHRPGR
jgi:DNA-binding transcriptional LysR family regulator